MSNKSKFRLLSQSFFVFVTVSALSVSGLLAAQNPYYSAAANSQVTSYGSASPVNASMNGSSVQESQIYSDSAVQPVSTMQPAKSIISDSTAPTAKSPFDAHPSSVVSSETPVLESVEPSNPIPATPPTEAVISQPVGQNAEMMIPAQGVPVQMVSAQPSVTENVPMQSVPGEIAPLYPSGYMTSPGYPRNNEFSPEPKPTPEPEAKYPETKEEMAPDLIRRDPALTPYAQQETYSYFTDTSTSSASACQICNEGYGNPYLWQFGAAAKIKHRARIEKSLPVFAGEGSTTAYPTTITSNTSFGIAPGLEANITRYLGRSAFNYDIWCDLRFDGLYEWEANHHLYPHSISSTDPPCYSEFFNGIRGLTIVSMEDESGATLTSIPVYYHFNYKIQMNSGEVMFQFRKRGRPDPLIGHPNGTWTRECQGGPRYTHKMGINYTSYNENLNWDGLAYIYNEDDEVKGTDTGAADVRTKNNMLGLVLGGEFVDKHCVWSWGMDWRFTPYLNMMENRVQLTSSSSNAVLSDQKLSDTDVSYMAQWGIFTTYKTGKHFIWKLGYDVSCYGNLALASSNLVVNESISNDNYNIIQAMTFGCTVVW